MSTNSEDGSIMIDIDIPSEGEWGQTTETLAKSDRYALWEANVIYAHKPECFGKWPRLHARLICGSSQL